MKEDHVVQQLVTRPMLYDGHKADFRLYVLVVFDPLGAPRVLVHQNGGVKVAPVAWHRENSSSARDAAITNPPGNEGYLWRHAISEMGAHLGAARWSAMWSSMVEAVVHAVLAIGRRLGCRNPNSTYANPARCGRSFQMLGVDVVIDTAKDTAHIMEANPDPGFLPWMSEVRTRSRLHKGAKRPAYRMYEEVYVDMLSAVGFDAAARRFAHSLSNRSFGLRTSTRDSYNASLVRDSTGFVHVFPTRALCDRPAVRARLARAYVWPASQFPELAPKHGGRMVGGSCEKLYPPGWVL